MFDHIPAYPGDPILSLNEDFQLDPRPNKVNLSIGIYFDDAGKLPVMDAVRRAETALLDSIGPRSYLPMAGLPLYRDAAQALVFGADSEARAAGRIATLQTIGGSGALKVGADFLKRYFPASQIWISDPSWENHRVVFEGAGLTVNTYPYYDEHTGGLRFADMIDDDRPLARAERRAAARVLPQPDRRRSEPGAMGRTGAGIAAPQTDRVCRHGVSGFRRRPRRRCRVRAPARRCGRAVDRREFVLEEFLAVWRALRRVERGVQEHAKKRRACSGQLMSTVRANYSNPPTHGARLVANVLADASLRASWEAELATMRERILAMRGTIHDGLAGRVDEVMRARYVAQRGMFTYTGLSESSGRALAQRIRGVCAAFGPHVRGRTE